MVAARCDVEDIVKVEIIDRPDLFVERLLRKVAPEIFEMKAQTFGAFVNGDVSESAVLELEEAFAALFHALRDRSRNIFERRRARPRRFERVLFFKQIVALLFFLKDLAFEFIRDLFGIFAPLRFRFEFRFYLRRSR